MMMHSRDHEAKSESVKIQVGRRSSQQKKVLDALHASPDFRKLHKEVLPREQQIHTVYLGKCVIIKISDKVLRGTGQQWDEQGVLFTPQGEQNFVNSQSGEVKARCAWNQETD